MAKSIITVSLSYQSDTLTDNLPSEISSASRDLSGVLCWGFVNCCCDTGVEIVERSGVLKQIQ